MEEILALINSSNARERKQFQKKIDGIQKEVARKIACSPAPKMATSRRESQEKASDDTAHQLMDVDPAVLQVISTRDDWSTDTYKMVMKKNAGRLSFLSHDYEVNGELSGPDSLIKFAIYDLKCKKRMFTVAFVEIEIATPRRAAGSQRSFVTLHPPNFEWRDTQTVHINPAMRAFEFEITVTIRRIPEPALHLPTISRAITSERSANIEPLKVELPDGLKTLFRAFSVDNNALVLAVSSENVPRSEKAVQEQKETAQSTAASAEVTEDPLFRTFSVDNNVSVLAVSPEKVPRSETAAQEQKETEQPTVAPAEVTEADAVIRKFERSLRLLKERTTTIQSAAEPRSDAVRNAKGQVSRAAGGAEKEELSEQADSDKEISLEMELTKYKESKLSDNDQACSNGNEECLFGKFAQRKSCSERLSQKLKETRQSVPATGGADVQKLIKIDEVGLSKESNKKPEKREPGVVVQSASPELRGGSFGQRFKGLKKTPPSKKEGRSPDKLLARIVLDVPVALDKSPKKEKSVAVRPESSEARYGFVAQRLERLPRSEKVSPEQKVKDWLANSADGADPSYLEIAIVPYEEVALERSTKEPASSAAVQPAPSKVRYGSFGQRLQGLKTKPSSEKATQTQEDKEQSALAAGSAEPSYLEIAVVPYEEVARNEPTKERASVAAVQPASSKVRYGSFGQRLQLRKETPTQKEHPALAADGADLGNLETRIVPEKEVAVDEESTQPSEYTVDSNPFASREHSFTQFEREILDRLRRVLKACERMPYKQTTGTHSPSMSQAAPKEVHDQSMEKGAG